MGELTFYVFDNLRAGREGSPPDAHVYRYDSLEEAVSTFKGLPVTWTTALGCSIGRRQEIDLVQRINGEPVKVTDFLRMAAFRDREDVHAAMDNLLEELSVHYQMEHGILPRKAVLVPLASEERTYSEVNGKILAGDDFNEVYVEGDGWVKADDFRSKYNTSSYEDPKMPVVKFVNASYVELKTGRRGQLDTHPTGYLKLVDQTKHHLQSLEEREVSR